MLFCSKAGLGEVEIGRWIGASHRDGRLMSYWILPESGIPVSATTVQRMTNNERSTDEMQKRMRDYDSKLERIFVIQSANISQKTSNEDPAFFDEFTRIIDDAALPHVEESKHAGVEVTTDQYIGMELALATGDKGERLHAKVRKILYDEDGRPIGSAHSNPFLDSRKYEVEYADGHVEELTANIIAENLFAQVDEEGRQQMTLGAIMDHRVSQEAVPRSHGTYVNHHGETAKNDDAWMGVACRVEGRIHRLGDFKRLERVIPT